MNRIFDDLKKFLAENPENLPPKAGPITRFAFFTCKRCEKKWKQALPLRGDGEVLPDFDVVSFCDVCLEKITWNGVPA